MKNIGHHTFFGIYVEYAFPILLKKFVKKYMMNFNVVNVLHHLPPTILYNQHISCTSVLAMTFSEPGCANHLLSIWVFWWTMSISTFHYLFLKDSNTRILPWPYKAAVAINIRWISFVPQLLLWFCPRLSLQVFDLIILKGVDK